MLPDDSREQAERFALLGEQQLHSGNHEQAVQMLRRALSLEPNVARYHGLMALALTNLKRYLAAEHEAKMALQLDPEDLTALIALGVVYHATGRYQQALQVLEKCIEQAPQNAFLWAMLAATNLSLERYEAAEQAARHALHLDPENATALSALAESLRLRGKHEEAERLALQGLARDPEDEVMHTLRAWAALQRGDPQTAIEHSLHALARDPQNEDARQVLLLACGSRRAWMRPYVRLQLWLSRFRTPYRIAILVGGYAALNLLLRGLSQYTTQAPALEPVLWVLIAAFWVTVLYLIVCAIVFHRMTSKGLGGGLS
ncbi:MAG: tetratricopeptide repeat protein [Armatimonadota bacterium]|nr:tetratricopeptide repeat protein [Armatimonadota bacterium]